MHLVVVGLNSNSAADFIYIFRHMVRGQIYKQAINADATEYLIQSIRRDYGETEFKNAPLALGEHIPYNGGAMLGHLAVLEKYRFARPPNQTEARAWTTWTARPPATNCPTEPSGLLMLSSGPTKSACMSCSEPTDNANIVVPRGSSLLTASGMWKPITSSRWRAPAVTPFRT